MMPGPYALELALPNFDQQKPHQRRGHEIEAPFAILSQVFFKVFCSFELALFAPIFSSHVDRNILANDLKRLAEALPFKRGSQCMMPAYDLRPGCLEGFNIQLALKPDRKSTRLNSTHVSSSYAVSCLK